MPQVIDQTQNTNEINRVSLVEHRSKRQESWSQALVWGDQPDLALAHAFGVQERELIIRRPNAKDFA